MTTVIKSAATPRPQEARAATGCPNAETARAPTWSSPQLTCTALREQQLHSHSTGKLQVTECHLVATQPTCATLAVAPTCGGHSSSCSSFHLLQFTLCDQKWESNHTEKAPRLTERVDTFFPPCAGTGMAHVSTSALLGTVTTAPWEREEESTPQRLMETRHSGTLKRRNVLSPS